MKDSNKLIKSAIDGGLCLPPDLTKKILSRIYSEEVEANNLCLYFQNFNTGSKFPESRDVLSSIFESFDGFLEVSESSYNGDKTGGLVIYRLSWPEGTNDIYETAPSREFVAACRATLGDFIRVFWATGEELRFNDTFNFPFELYNDILQIVNNYKNDFSHEH